MLSYEVTIWKLLVGSLLSETYRNLQRRTTQQQHNNYNRYIKGAIVIMYLV